MKKRLFAATLVIVLSVSLMASAAQRFPPPDFESGYRQPPLTFQRAPIQARQVVDTIMLLAALGAAAWLLLKHRSRAGVFVLGLICLLYFGFYKKGCICPIGAIQNVTLALTDKTYAIPLLVVATFILPLVFALVCGRVFCGAVCPLGAIQDVFLIRPVRVPGWLESGLGLFRYFALGLGVYFAYRSGIFYICKYDPFVGLFRLGDHLWKLVLGGAFLLVGMFVGRPYCRFLCPYGALLSLFSRWSATGVTVTPDECIKCTLCHDSCPFGAIRPPVRASSASSTLKIGLWLSAFALVAGLGSAGYFALDRTGAGAVLGVWFGLVIGVKLVSLTSTREREEYSVDHAMCLSCGRCYEYCPREQKRLKKKAEELG